MICAYMWSVAYVSFHSESGSEGQGSSRNFVEGLADMRRIMPRPAVRPDPVCGGTGFVEQFAAPPESGGGSHESIGPGSPLARGPRGSRGLPGEPGDRQEAARADFAGAGDRAGKPDLSGR